MNKVPYVKPAPIGANVLTTDDVIAAGYDYSYLKMGGMLKVPGATVDGDLTVGAGAAFSMKVLALSTQPAKETSVAVGGTATLTVAGADGLAPYTYQWYKRSSGQDEQEHPTQGKLIEGATAASYKITKAAKGDAGTYYAVVRDNADNQVVSDPAVVKVTEAAPSGG